jgi:flagellar basal-body rod modification protein FlgD
MATVSDVSSTDTSTAAAALASAQTNSLVSDTQNQFLTLLVTQLQNQDPLNPMDNSEVTSQIAQLSTVNGIQQLNSTLLALSGQMDMSQSLQAANLIGKDILYPGTKVALGSDPSDPTVKTATPFGVDLMSGTATTTVTILDSSGKAVRKMDLGAQAAGIYSLSWDGTDDSGNAVPDGAYTIQVNAADAKGQAVSADTLTSGYVSSVAYTTDGLKLNLALGDKISLLDVRQVM